MGRVDGHMHGGVEGRDDKGSKHSPMSLGSYIRACFTRDWRCAEGVLRVCMAFLCASHFLWVTMRSLWIDGSTLTAVLEDCVILGNRTRLDVHDSEVRTAC